jgi:RHS repeat-associated protein
VAATDLSGNPTTHSWTVTVPDATSTYAYDSNGNLTQKTEGNDTWTYEWDAENQLKRVLKNATEVARYAYDPMGRRVEKVAAGVTKTYTYDVDKILREASSAGTTLIYVEGSGSDEPLTSEDQTGVRTYLHADGLGSIVKTTNSAGAVTSTIRYNAFGVLESGTPISFAFTGREWDAETALYYYRARYVDPNVGRFLSEDPAQDQLNLYSYVSSNPVNRTDPDGLYELKTFPAHIAVEVNMALLSILQKMKEKPCCAGSSGPDVVNVMSDPNLVIEWDPSISSKIECAETPHPRVPRFLMRPKIKIGPLALQCCANMNAQTPENEGRSMAGIVLHELMHLATRSPREGLPYSAQEQCFGCARPQGL